MKGIDIEVAYATPEKQRIIALQVPEGTTIAEAIELSGIRGEFPGMEVGDVGVFSKRRKLEDEVQAGERIEIYRPLIADPKTARRRKAERQRREGQGEAD